MTTKTILTIAILVIGLSLSGCIKPEQTNINEIDAKIILSNYSPDPIYTTPAIKVVNESNDSIMIQLEIIDYNTTYWNETTPETVYEFLCLVPKCPWYNDDAINMCSMLARYTIIEAHTHGIDLNEITISHRTGVMSGHRVPTFEHEDQSYYLTNLYKGDTRIVDKQGLNNFVTNLMGIDSYGFKDHKIFDDDWFERNGY